MCVSFQERCTLWLGRSGAPTPFRPTFCLGCKCDTVSHLPPRGGASFLRQLRLIDLLADPGGASKKIKLCPLFSSQANRKRHRVLARIYRRAPRFFLDCCFVRYHVVNVVLNLPSGNLFCSVKPSNTRETNGHPQTRHLEKDSVGA